MLFCGIMSIKLNEYLINDSFCNRLHSGHVRMHKVLSKAQSIHINNVLMMKFFKFIHLFALAFLVH